MNYEFKTNIEKTEFEHLLKKQRFSLLCKNMVGLL